MSDNWQAVDFETVAIEDGAGGEKVLVVRGETTSGSDKGAEVMLMPVTYIAQPEYWRIEVMWNRADAIFQSMTPYEARFAVQGTMGSKGVEIAGATKSRKIDL